MNKAQNIIGILHELYCLVLELDEDNIINKTTKDVLLSDITDMKISGFFKSVTDIIIVYLDRWSNVLLIKNLVISRKQKIDILNNWSKLGFSLLDHISEDMINEEAILILEKYKHIEDIHVG